MTILPLRMQKMSKSQMYLQYLEIYSVDLGLVF